MDKEARKEVVKKEAVALGLTVTESKPWWQSKTLRVNILVLLAAFLTWMAGSQFPFDLGQYAELVAVALAIVNVVLRFMTGQPITTSKK